MTDFTIGVDVSKDTLDVHIHPAGGHRQFPNTPTGFRTIVRWIADRPVARLVFEATGPYHRAVERAMGEAGLSLCKVNPRQAKRFGEALGQLAKTDRMDAEMLARFGALIEPDVRPAPSKIISDLKDLHVARTARIKDRTAARNREKSLQSPLLKHQSRERLAQIERHLEAIEAGMLALVESDQDLARRLAILTSIPGLATRSAFALIADMPELGALDRQATAALSGTAPMTRQSGKRTGKAFVTGGGVNVRQALYMPALVAARFNPDFSAIYQAMTARGKPPKVALTAIMRKLIILANALIKADRKWEQRPA
ncbi:IS110 family transposase [Pelagibacterium montanilacus]|uniref:IS110 family transposase n=1 Tax=Pelagibacterium montanilacus TaxID=2185280 RepID=UPI000F8DDCF6|nr:IS110 family transposase [Pelagibacterium montanilacus]